MDTALPNFILFEQVTSTNQVAAEWLTIKQSGHGDFFIANTRQPAKATDTIPGSVHPA